MSDLILEAQRVYTFPTQAENNVGVLVKRKRKAFCDLPEQQQQHHQQQQPQSRMHSNSVKVQQTIQATRYHPSSLRAVKSASLDHEIFSNRKAATKTTTQTTTALPIAAASEWKRTISTSSLASSATTTTMTTTAAANYQELKMEIINQGKCLCGQYIRSRLRRAGVLNRKAIQRLRTKLEPSSEIVYEVFPALNTMAEELERLHPKIYTNVARQLSRRPYGELEDCDAAPTLMNLVAKDLFRSSITWGKIISIFAVCGGFACDIVRQGHYEYLQALTDSLGEIIEDDLVHWLMDQGGWLGLQQHIRPHAGHFSFLGWMTLFVTVASSVYVISNFINHIGCRLYSMFF